MTLAASGTVGLGGEAAHAPTADDRAVPIVEPLRTTRHRCQTIGDATLADTRCRAAWSAHRRRFLGIEPPKGAGR